MDTCIFCKIAAGEIPSKTVYEDEEFRAILDISPASEGHVLILPKIHAADLFELPEETASRVLVLAKKLATAMKKSLGFPALKIVQNNGALAGQTVMHYHLHLIPCYNGSEVTDWKPLEMQDATLTAIRDKIVGAMSEG